MAARRAEKSEGLHIGSPEMLTYFEHFGYPAGPAKPDQIFSSPGSTVKRRLAAAGHRWGDERFLPAGDPDRNKTRAAFRPSSARGCRPGPGPPDARARTGRTASDPENCAKSLRVLSWPGPRPGRRTTGRCLPSMC